jgi:hypothetical protein
VIPVKVIALGVIATVLVFGVRGAYKTAWQSGYDAAQLEVSRDVQKRIADGVERAREQWENLTDIAETQIVTETEIVEVERIVEKEIPVVVEKIIERTPECDDLGDDFARLLNAQVTAGASANQPPVRENSADTDAGM